MNRLLHCRTWIGLTVTTVFFACIVMGHAEDSIAQNAKAQEWTTGPGYLLLSTGNVMSGTITKLEHEYQVQVDEGSMVKLRKSQVHYVGKDIPELYQHLKSSYVRQGTGEHIQLARWCIENGLLDEAGEHYRFLKERIPEHPQLRTIAVMLKQKLALDPVTRMSVGLPPEKPNADKTKDGRQLEGEHVQLASSNSAASLGSSATGERSGIGSTPRAGSEIASPVVAMNFREHVLPVFRNRCGQAGCHGNQSKTDLVFQPSHTQMFASSQKSLLATLKYIDLQRPAESVLIKKATTPHGTQRKPPFDLGSTDDARVFQNIQEWIQLVASERQATSIDGQNRPLPSIKTSTPMMTASEAVNPFQTNPGSEGVATAGTSGLGSGVHGAEIDQLEGLIRNLEEVEKRKKTSDPFDPARFNQRFAGSGAGGPTSDSKNATGAQRSNSLAEQNDRIRK